MKIPYAESVAPDPTRKDLAAVEGGLRALGHFPYCPGCGGAGTRTRLLVGGFETRGAAADFSLELQRQGFNAGVTRR